MKWDTMSTSEINRIILSPKYKPLLAILKGLRNGAVYGAKVRFAHALVVTFLFKGGKLQSQIETVLQATYMHSRNLAMFVFTYKSLTTLLRQMEGHTRQYHSFVAAFIGGYLVFGRFNHINEQINLYLLSRVIYGLIKMAASKQLIPQPNTPVFPWFAAVVWGLVLWMFEYHGSSLQPSLRSSMTYLYHDSERWTNLKTLLFHNQ